MPGVRRLAGQQLEWKFPFPPERAWNKTYIHCARLCVQRARESAGCIRSGWTYRNTSTGGRSEVRSCISDSDSWPRSPPAAASHIAHNAKPCGFRACSADAGQTYLFWLDVPAPISGALPCRRYPDIRVAGIFDLTREVPNGVILSLLPALPTSCRQQKGEHGLRSASIVILSGGVLPSE